MDGGGGGGDLKWTSERLSLSVLERRKGECEQVYEWHWRSYDCSQLR